MIKRFIYYLVLIMTFITIITFSFSNVNAKYISHNETPTEIRGNWYQYFGNNKWQKLTINKKKIYLTGYTQNKHWKNLSIDKTNIYLHNSGMSNYGYPNFSYDIENKNSYPDPNTFSNILGVIFPSTKKYNNQRILITYGPHIAAGNPWTRDKIRVHSLNVYNDLK